MLGDGGVGKSCLTIQFCQNIFVYEYDPTIENLYRKQVGIDGGACVLEILDTAGQEDYSTMKDQHMRSGDGFLLVYAVDDRSSFADLATIRDSVLRAKDATKIPMVLVAAKADLENKRAVSTWEGSELANSFSCPFIEVSALHRIKVDDGFLLVIREIKAFEEERAQQAGDTPRHKKATYKCTLL